MHHLNALNATIIHSIQLLFLDLNNKLFGDLKRTEHALYILFAVPPKKTAQSSFWRLGEKQEKSRKMHSI